MKTLSVIIDAILVLLIVGGVAACIVGGAMYSCSSLFTKSSLIAQGHSFSFAKRNFGHGELYVCSFTDMNGVRKTIDMYGHNVNDSVYKPHVIDDTPDYGTADW